jgi:hypothetical protein
MSKQLQAIYGTSEPPQKEEQLEAGPLSALFVNGALRSIKLQGVEVIRGMYFLIRDRNWSTVVPELSDLKIERGADGFKLSFTCTGVTPSDNQTLVWRGSIVGSASKGLTFKAAARPDSDFVTCRTGFIVLHPLDRVVGCPVTIEHSDGSTTESMFPEKIDPLQCFFDIRAMTHEPIPGIAATCRMTGGTWETEDHRNWLDASFKTYFRPLILPWPYTVPAGEVIEQSVSLTFSPSIAKLKPLAESAETAVVVGDGAATPMPRIGLGVDAADIAAALRAAPQLAAAGIQSLSIRVTPETADLSGVLRRAQQLADRLGARSILEIVLPCAQPPEIELDLVAIAVASAGFEPEAVVVSPEVDLHSYPPSVNRPSSPPLDALYAAARAAFPGVPLGGGVFSFFPELNRRRPPADLLDFVQHATCSITHAADDRSVMETIESLPHVFRSTRAFIGRTGYRVGPSNIGMPFNPYGAATTPNPESRRITMVTEDPRQRGLFAAAWALGYWIRAAQAGIDALTLMAPTGPFGILDEKQRRPAFAAIEGMASMAGAGLVQTTTSDPQSLLAVAAERRGRRTLWLVNLTSRKQSVTLSGFRPQSLAVLDETAGGTFQEKPVRGADLTLTGYSLARLEG